MEKLTKIVFAVSLIGILSLLFISNQAEPELMNIGEITESHLNQQVKIVGEMAKVRNYDDAQFQVITIKDRTGSIDITSNSKTSINKTEDLFMIIGEVAEYQGELQINADKIIKIER